MPVALARTAPHVSPLAVTTAVLAALTAGACGRTKQPQCGSEPGDLDCRFLDPDLPLEERIDDLLSLLEPDEKLEMLFSRQAAVPRLRVPAFNNTEGLHGVAWHGGADNTVLSTQFPQAFGLAQSWDPEVMRLVGATTGAEIRYLNAFGSQKPGLAVRAPMIDLGRHPLWGRTEESYGEDPHLASELGKGMIAGLQGDDPRVMQVASTLKHFLANNNETNREGGSSDVDERNLREYYMEPFREALTSGRAQSFMTAYNAINGIPATVTPILREVVRAEWGFDGMICTDGDAINLLVTAHHAFPDAVTATAASIKAGQAVMLTRDRDAVKQAYARGLLTLADVDDVLRTNLRMRFRVGDFDPVERVPYRQFAAGTPPPWNDPAAHARALDVARRTVLLLKNQDGALPLDRSAIRSIAIAGPRADSVLRDWYGGLPPYVVTPRAGIAAKLAETNGTAVVRKPSDDTPAAAAAAAAGADVAVVFIGNHPTCGDNQPWATCPLPEEGREAVDRKSLEVEPGQLELLKAVHAANPRTVVVLVSSFPQALGWIDEHIPAIVHSANSGQELGTAIADVLFGDVDPGARTTMTWYRSLDDIPAITEYDIRKGLTYLYFTGTPLYPFGYGLSYTTFAYANLTVADSAVGPGDSTTVAVDITNTGTRAGDEVVQLYVAYPDSKITRPRQQLRGFRRIHLEAGETHRLTFPLAASALTTWDVGKHAFVLEAGTVDIQVGASSRDIRLNESLTTRP